MKKKCNNCKKLGTICPGTPSGNAPGLCFGIKLASPQAEQSEASSLSAGLCCPWDKYIKESDGNFKDFGAWERWLNELDDAILEDMEIELRSSLYGIMIDMLKAT